MLFNSFEFVVFLIVVFSVYWLIPHRWRSILLLLSSYIFYMFSKPEYGLIIGSVTLLSYGAARIIDGTEEPGNRRRILTVLIVLCAGVLFFFKYFNFVSSSLGALFRMVDADRRDLLLDIMLPIGISFYTFQAIGYTVDVYRREIPAERDFISYAAFVSFFPQLVAGPIERTGNLLPQLKKEKHFQYEQGVRGLILILGGYYKKLVIADGISKYVRTVYGHVQLHDGFALVLATLLFTIQIYCDFSGYSDIAIGTAKLFGIDLMRNFRSPYMSGSIREFWSRWHISLSTWFRDYIYIPLGGNRVGRLRHAVNLMITFLVSGLWHGANWTFVLWGGIHGLVQVVEYAVFGKEKKKTHGIGSVIRIPAVFLFCSFAWIFFVSANISDAVYVITHLFSGIGSFSAYLQRGLSDLGIGKTMLALILVLLLPLMTQDVIEWKTGDFNEWFMRKNKWMRWLVCLFIGMLIIYSPAKGAAAEFIYFQF